jgi:acyl-CoA reductase-like NAD-dependent aldehyde dehydrogenase
LRAERIFDFAVLKKGLCCASEEYVVAVDLIYAVAFAKLARREANLLKRMVK